MMTNPLAEVIPAKYRRYVYLVAAALLFGYALWEVAAGDIRTFIVSIVSSLVSGLAASNTPASRVEVTEAAVELVEDEPQVVQDALDAEDAERGQFFDGHSPF